MTSHTDRFLEAAVSKIDFRDKVVLEIGCGDGSMLRKIAELHRPSFIRGIDVHLDSWWSSAPSKGENWEIRQEDATCLSAPDNYFDVVISVATFEHINDLRTALSEIKRVLKPGGVFFTEFAPIWTSIVGHHYNFWIYEDVDLIPPWGHLWMNEDEMRKYLEPKVGQKKTDEACYFIYHSDLINRLGRNDFHNIITNCGMRIVEMIEFPSLSRFHYYGVETSELTPDIMDKLSDKYQLHEIIVDGFRILLQNNEF